MRIMRSCNIILYTMVLVILIGIPIAVEAEYPVTLNVSPHIQLVGVPVHVSIDSPHSLVAKFTWDDGTPSSGWVSPLSSEHSYRRIGDYTIEGLVRDDKGGPPGDQDGWDGMDVDEVHIFDVRFKESAPLSGFDDSVTPPWLIVPYNGTNTVLAEIIPVSANSIASSIEYISIDPSVCTVTPTAGTATPQTLSVVGATANNTEIQATKGPTVAERLYVDVKNRRNIKVSFHIISDIAGHSASIPYGRSEIIPYLNRIYGKQANVYFSERLYNDKTVDTDLGSVVDYGYGYTNLDDIRRSAKDFDAFMNVYYVWSLDNPNTFADEQGLGRGSSYRECFFENGTTLQILAHEIGHALNLDHGGPDSSYLMYSTGYGGVGGGVGEKIRREEVTILQTY